MKVPLIEQGDSFTFKIIKYTDKTKTERVDLSNVTDIYVQLSSSNVVFFKAGTIDNAEFPADNITIAYENGEITINVPPSMTEVANPGQIKCTLKIIDPESKEETISEIIGVIAKGDLKKIHGTS